MRILKTKGFARDAKLQGLSDAALKEAVKEFARGLTGNVLGGNLFKKRVAVGGKGKSGGLRSILVYRASSDKVFCIYLFAKKQKANIEEEEVRALKKIGKVYLEMTDEQIHKATAEGKLLEVREDDDKEENDKDNDR